MTEAELQRNLKNLLNLFIDSINIFFRRHKKNSVQVIQHDSRAKESINSFSSHYETHVRPLVLDTEQKRIAALIECKKRLWILLVTTLVMIFIAYLVKGYAFGFLHVVVFMIAIIFGLLLWAHLPKFKYYDQFKSTIFSEVIKFYGDDFKLCPTDTFPMDTAWKSSIVPLSIVCRLEDYVKGTYKGVLLQFVEARVRKGTFYNAAKQDTLKVIEVVSSFEGVLILFEVYKNFSGNTIIVTDKGRIKNYLKEKTISHMENVRLEDPVFEKKFEVYSTDQGEARYLLTVTFMERLLELATVMKGKIECSFYDKSLLIKVETNENYFKPGPIYKPVEQSIVRDINTVRKELSVLFGIINILKLDQRTGL